MKNGREKEKEGKTKRELESQDKGNKENREKIKHSKLPANTRESTP
jgi:hypothetical protein